MCGERQLQCCACEEHCDQVGVHVTCWPPILVPIAGGKAVSEGKFPITESTLRTSCLQPGMSSTNQSNRLIAARPLPSMSSDMTGQNRLLQGTQSRGAKVLHLPAALLQENGVRDADGSLAALHPDCEVQ